jgi:hypothetical protein
MELYLARKSLAQEPNSQIKIEDIESKLDSERFFYLDRENDKINLDAVVTHFEDKGFKVHLREVRYGLGDLDYIYELHIV